MVSRKAADDLSVGCGICCAVSEPADNGFDEFALLRSAFTEDGDVAMVFSPIDLGFNSPELLGELPTASRLDGGEADFTGSLNIFSKLVCAVSWDDGFARIVLAVYFAGPLLADRDGIEVDVDFCSFEGFRKRKEPPLTKAFGGENNDPGDGTAADGPSFVGEFRPGGLKGCLTGETDRTVEGVLGRELRALEAGRRGGPI